MRTATRRCHMNTTCNARLMLQGLRARCRHTPPPRKHATARDHAAETTQHACAISVRLLTAHRRRAIRHATCAPYTACHATYSVPHATCNMPLATCNMHHATRKRTGPVRPLQPDPPSRAGAPDAYSGGVDMRALMSSMDRELRTSTVRRGPTAPLQPQPPAARRPETQHARSRAHHRRSPSLSRTGGVPPCWRVHFRRLGCPWAAAPRRLRAA